MAKLLALDVGSKTIGVAYCDESQRYVFAGETIFRQPEGHRRDMAALKRVVEAREIEGFVVGLPLTLDGEVGIQAQKVQAFAELLTKYFDLPIVFHDERLTTFEAEGILLAAHRKPSRHKQVIDSVAASLILESYLASRPVGVEATEIP